MADIIDLTQDTPPPSDNDSLIEVEQPHAPSPQRKRPKRRRETDAAEDEERTMPELRRSKRRKLDSHGKKLPCHTRSLFPSKPQSTKKNDTIRRCGRSLTLIHRDPNVYQIDGFLTESEHKHLLEIVQDLSENFAQSFTDEQATEKDRVVSDHRTSTFIYLNKFHDALTRRIESRVSDMLGLPIENIEPLQIVSYTKGQYFGSHHDSGSLIEPSNETSASLFDLPPDISDLSVDIVCPRRLCSMFVYLNDVPMGAGGQTDFPYLNVSCQPRARTAILWCNVDPNNTHIPDSKLIHCARPITVEGVRKLGMNVWVTDQAMISQC